MARDFVAQDPFNAVPSDNRGAAEFTRTLTQGVLEETHLRALVACWMLSGLPRMRADH